MTEYNFVSEIGRRVFYSQIAQIQEVLWASIGILVGICILYFMLMKRIPVKMSLVAVLLVVASYGLSQCEPPQPQRIDPQPTPRESPQFNPPVSKPRPVRDNPPAQQSGPIPDFPDDPVRDASPTPTVTPNPTPHVTRDPVIVFPSPTLTPWSPSPTPYVTPPKPTATPRQSSQVYVRPSERPRFEAVRVEKLDRGVKVRLFDSRKESWLDDELHILEKEPRIGSIIEVAEVRAVYIGAKNIPGATEPVR